ncbi:MAG TPA: SDR family oxidoreductase [Bacteroidia bacterium]
MNKQKIALITGASRGLGKNMAIALAQKGVDIVFTYNQKADAANDTIKEIEALGQKAKAFQLNTGLISGFDAFFTELNAYLTETYGEAHFDYLINNAGSSLQKMIVETTEEQMDEMYNIHFKGVFYMVQKSLPFIQDGGRIINISSGLTRTTFPGLSVYASMKGAIDTFTKYVAKELSSRRIAVNVVAPGAIATDFGGGRVRDNQEYNQLISGLTALGRVGLAEDIGPVVAFLCSEDGRWINGQRIEVSGGMNL